MLFAARLFAPGALEGGGVDEGHFGAGAAQQRLEATERKRRELERKRGALEAQILALRAQFETEADEIQKEIAFEKTREQVLEAEKLQMARMRLGNGATKEKRERYGKGA